MADTWRCYNKSILRSFGHLMELFNGSGSGRVLRLRRVVIINDFVSGTTQMSALIFMQLLKTTQAARGLIVVTPVPHDTNNAALPSQITAHAHGGSDIATSGILRQWQYAPEGCSLTATRLADYQMMIPIAEVWNLGYRESTVKPLVLRESQGVVFKNASDFDHSPQEANPAANIPSYNTEFEFTNEAS